MMETALCHRCEHRVLNIMGIEKGPRLECETPLTLTVKQLRTRARGCCYCYVPVRPMILERATTYDDKRPTGTGYFAARSAGVKVYEANLELHTIDAKSESWVALYKKPRKGKG